NRLGQERFAHARVADEEHAARNAPAQPLELLGILEELHDLGELFLGLINAGHIIKRDIGVLFGEQAVARAAEIAQHADASARRAYLAQEEKPDEQENQNIRQHVEQ